MVGHVPYAHRKHRKSRGDRHSSADQSVSERYFRLFFTENRCPASTASRTSGFLCLMPAGPTTEKCHKTTLFPSRYSGSDIRKTFRRKTKGESPAPFHPESPALRRFRSSAGGYRRSDDRFHRRQSTSVRQDRPAAAAKNRRRWRGRHVAVPACDRAPARDVNGTVPGSGSIERTVSK